MLALYNSYWATMNKIYIYARPCVNTDFFHELMCPAFCLFTLSTKYPNINSNDAKLSRILQ